jgi:hypothetical protein
MVVTAYDWRIWKEKERRQNCDGAVVTFVKQNTGARAAGQRRWYSELSLICISRSILDMEVRAGI